jgi:hypothetical protein
MWITNPNLVSEKDLLANFENNSDNISLSIHIPIVFYTNYIFNNHLLSFLTSYTIISNLAFFED